MRRQRGFSLIELLIVVAIILIIAAMAVPSLLSSKMAANEASAVSSLRTITTAETTYALTYPNVGYADELAKLSYAPSGQPVSSTHAGIIDLLLGCSSQPCLKSGYQFSITGASGSPVNTYVAVGTPKTAGVTGVRGFCADQASKITVDPGGTSACSIPLK
jgi:type IV pilus assembly protein PilA